MIQKKNKLPPRLFSYGKRPVIRWVKGDGKDDMVTRSAIGQATKLFGDSVDYCLCTNNISSSRARNILAWATQPVELMQVTAKDNPQLAHELKIAGCEPEAYGYWWKWFPARVRPNAPEWILDGDMIITGIPPWFETWKKGEDVLRVTQDDAWKDDLYGEYNGKVDLKRRLYSGLISLPPNLDYNSKMIAILRAHPLKPFHDGRKNMSEQGVIAMTFDALQAVPIPLNEFPFARAFEEKLNFGLSGPKNKPWGYHFGNAFVSYNPHFKRMIENKRIFWHSIHPKLEERFEWLRAFSQWGKPGWSTHRLIAYRMGLLAGQCKGKPVLEIATSRGYVTALMASRGAQVTTIDKVDRGAGVNLEGLNVDVHVQDVFDFLNKCDTKFALITVDLHGNRPDRWKKLWPLLVKHLETDGRMVLCNSHLWKIPEWYKETGLLWLMNNELKGWKVEVFEEPLPGMIVVQRE